jgi:heme/copper-type cytochrome/quinol oxidase subunit 2
MDSKTYNAILGRVFNILVILTFLIALAVTVGNTIYFKKLYDDNGSKSITADTANAFYGVNLAIAILTLLVLIMYFFKRIVLTIWFMIVLVLLVTGIIGMTITSTIYFKKLWDDDGTTNVSSKVAKNMFFFNLTVAIVSLIIFLIYLYKWYDLYNLESKLNPPDLVPKNTRGFDINTRPLTEEERIATINRQVLNATRPQTPVRSSRSTRGYSGLPGIVEEEDATEEEDNTLEIDEELAMLIANQNMMSQMRRRSPYTNTSVSKNKIIPSPSRYSQFVVQRPDGQTATYTAGSFSSCEEDFFDDEDED